MASWCALQKTQFLMNLISCPFIFSLCISAVVVSCIDPLNLAMNNSEGITKIKLYHVYVKSSPLPCTFIYVKEMVAIKTSDQVSKFRVVIMECIVSHSFMLPPVPSSECTVLLLGTFVCAVGEWLFCGMDV